MKYFNYNADCIVDNIAQYNKIFAFCLNNATDIDSAEPAVLTPSTIKLLLAKLKEEKNNFKNLATKFNILPPHEKLTLIKRYYDFSMVDLKRFQLEEFAREFPVKKTIKTSMFNATNAYATTYKSGHKQVKATVFAKKGIKFNPLKTYSKEEFSKMIANDEIVIVAKEEYGSIKECKDPNNFLTIETLAREFDDKTFDQDTIEILNKKNPVALEELLADISIKEIRYNYEHDYLPAYKKMLDYFVKCAKVTVAQNEANKKNMQKQINKANEQNREMEDVTKLIIDTSKGR